MIKFETKYFREFKYSKKGVKKYLKSAYKDLHIAKKAEIEDVIFQFSYNALIKLGISLLAIHGLKANSRMGHHIKIIEKMSEILGDEDVDLLGNKMRKIRNTELYDGGDSLVSRKQANEYLKFIEKLFKKAEKVFKENLGSLL